MSGIRLGWGKFNPSKPPKLDAGLTMKAGGSLAHSDEHFLSIPLFYSRDNDVQQHEGQ